MEELIEIQQGELSVGSLFQDAWSLTFKNFGRVLLVYLLAWAIPIALGTIPVLVASSITPPPPLGTSSGPNPIGVAFMFIFSTLGCAFIFPCWLRVCVGTASQVKFTLDDLPVGVPTILNVAGTILLCAMATCAGFFMFIIPGIYIAIRLLFAPFYAADRGIGPIESLRLSWQTTAGHWRVLLGLSLVFSIINWVAGWTVIGSLITGPVFGVFLALAYTRASALHELQCGEVG
mgnify:CR=1 FL=1